jgi:hypothetical protein
MACGGGSETLVSPVDWVIAGSLVLFLYNSLWVSWCTCSAHACHPGVQVVVIGLHKQ